MLLRELERGEQGDCDSAGINRVVDDLGCFEVVLWVGRWGCLLGLWFSGIH